MKTLVDTNIILDFVLRRRYFFKNAEKIFSLGEYQKVTLYASALSFGSTTHFLSREYTERECKYILSVLAQSVKILPFDKHIIEKSLYSNFKDIEDGYQYFTAKENSIPIIVTRNVKDFLVDDISVVTPEEFLAVSR